MILGLRQSRGGRRLLGTINRRVAFESPCAVMLLAKRTQGVTELVRPIQNVIPWRREEAS